MNKIINEIENAKVRLELEMELDEILLDPCIPKWSVRIGNDLTLEVWEKVTATLKKWKDFLVRWKEEVADEEGLTDKIVIFLLTNPIRVRLLFILGDFHN